MPTVGLLASAVAAAFDAESQVHIGHIVDGHRPADQRAAVSGHGRHLFGFARQRDAGTGQRYGCLDGLVGVVVDIGAQLDHVTHGEETRA